MQKLANLFRLPLYRGSVKKHNLTMHITHKPGDKLKVNWNGTRMSVSCLIIRGDFAFQHVLLCTSLSEYESDRLDRLLYPGLSLFQ